ncbi:MAG: response regulator [Nitrospinae bacterium]|nr:response regulator [Nitrospinota bacterium]
MVEDDDVWRMVARAYLERNNCRVIEAEDGRIGLEKYRRIGEDLHAVVSDVRMPHLSGYDLARINAAEHFLPFVLCTSLCDPETAREAFRHGVEDVLVKPVEERQLVKVIKSAMLRRRYGTASAENVVEAAGSRITIPARLCDVMNVKAWLAGKVGHLFTSQETRMYLHYAHEFIMNAYEHGSLGFYEAEKGRLMDEGTYEAELLKREAGCPLAITLEFVKIDDLIMLTVSDGGRGFDHVPYMNFRPEHDLKRLLMLNGRGILMGRHYFDHIRYENRGAAVSLFKQVFNRH